MLHDCHSISHYIIFKNTRRSGRNVYNYISVRNNWSLLASIDQGIPLLTGICLGASRTASALAKHESLGHVKWPLLTGLLICAMLSLVLDANALQPHSFWHQFSLPVPSRYGSCHADTLLLKIQINAQGQSHLQKSLRWRWRFPCGLQTKGHFSIKKFLEDPSIGHVVGYVLIRPAEKAKL